MSLTKNKILIAVFFAVLFNLNSHASAFVVSPPVTYAGEIELGKNYEFNVLMENDKDKNQTLQFSLAPSSSYLGNYVEFPSEIVLKPFERKEINVELKVPRKGLNPGEHSITILPDVIKSGSGVVLKAVTVIEIKFSLPGEVNKKLELRNFNIENVSENAFLFELSVKNTGNVRAEDVVPFIDIVRYGITVDSVRGRTHYKTDSSESLSMKVKYSTSLDEGTYKAIAYVMFDNKKTNTETSYFTVVPTEKGQEPVVDTELDNDSVKEGITVAGEPGTVDVITDINYVKTVEDEDIGDYAGFDKSTEISKTTKSKSIDKYLMPTGLAIFDLSKKHNILIVLIIIIALVFYLKMKKRKRGLNVIKEKENEQDD